MTKFEFLAFPYPKETRHSTFPHTVHGLQRLARNLHVLDALLEIAFPPSICKNQGRRLDRLLLKIEIPVDRIVVRHKVRKPCRLGPVDNVILPFILDHQFPIFN
jgi:hypothetical protein